MHKYDLSIVLPVHNPVVNWLSVLLDNISYVRSCLPKLLKIQFIVVNDSDVNAGLLKEISDFNNSHQDIRIVTYDINRGKGFALRRGISATDADYIIYTDFDFPYLFENIALMYQHLLEGYDVVKGKRKDEYYERLPVKRRIISRLHGRLNQAFLKIPFKDTQVGLKGFNQKGKEVFLQTTIDDYLVDAEFLTLAYQKHYDIKSIEVTLRGNIHFADMKSKVLINELKIFYYIIRRIQKSKNSAEKKSRLSFSSAKKWIFWGDFLRDSKLALILWFGLALIAAMSDLTRHHINNYTIFKNVYFHAIDGLNLYSQYPLQYEDVNLYGPFFSILIAPFAVLPDWLGVLLWAMGNAVFLYYAISKLPFEKSKRNTILILSANEMMLASAYLECNQAVIACIILAFVYINKKKEIWAAFFILLMAFVKIYSMAGLAFIFFSKKPQKLILWLGIWSILFFVAPMLISKFDFVTHSYLDWYQALIVKSAKNQNSIHQIGVNLQDISVMGMIRRMFNYTLLNDTLVMGIGFIVFLLQFARFKYFNDLRFRMYILCSVLLFTVIFSNGSEGPTYIIAFPAVCIWYLMQTKKKGWVNAFFIFALIFTGFGYSDILTPWFRNHISYKYATKALPCFILWIIIVIQILKKQFLKIQPLDKDEITYSDAKNEKIKIQFG